MKQMYPINTLALARMSLANLERNFRCGRHDKKIYSAAKKAILKAIKLHEALR